MTYAFTRTGPEIEAIHSKVDSIPNGEQILSRQNIDDPLLNSRDVRLAYEDTSASFRLGISDIAPLDDPADYFRGLNSTDAWGDQFNIGLGSSSLGRNGASYAYLSHTFGHDCVTYGVVSMAGGAGTATGDADDPDSTDDNSGYCSLAWGKITNAIGRSSFAMGEEVISGSKYSWVGGYQSQTGKGESSHPNTLPGEDGVVSDGLAALAHGVRSYAYGDGAMSLGSFTQAYNGSSVFGKGINAGSPLINPLPGSMYFGINVDLPTLTVREPKVLGNNAFGRVGVNTPVPEDMVDITLTNDEKAHISTPVGGSASVSLGGKVGGVNRGVFEIEWTHPNAGQPFGVTKVLQNESEVFNIDTSGQLNFIKALNLSGIGLHVNDVRVVGGQQGAIQDATVGTEVQTINAILTVLRAHGLIAT